MTPLQQQASKIGTRIGEQTILEIFARLGFRSPEKLTFDADVELGAGLIGGPWAQRCISAALPETGVRWRILRSFLRGYLGVPEGQERDWFLWAVSAYGTALWSTSFVMLSSLAHEEVERLDAERVGAEVCAKMGSEP